jgi:threonine/homoserine/homoserine lactone efflux protein
MEFLVSYLPLWAFIALMVGTPGPANLLMVSSTSAHGFKATMPFFLGIVTGKILLILFIALGFSPLIHAYPSLRIVFSLLSAFYLCYLALKGWNSGTSSSESTAPLTYVAGVFVHPLNPKGWVMVTLAYALFGPKFTTPFEETFLIPLSFLAAQFIFLPSWGLVGFFFRRQISNSPFLNRFLILLTIAAVLWALSQQPLF